MTHPGHDEEPYGDFTPLTTEEREELAEAGATSIPGQRLQAHLLARLALAEIEGADQHQIDIGIAESDDAGIAMGDEAFMDLPPERREVLRGAMKGMVMNATRHSVRQLELACNQLKVDCRPIVSAEAVALFASTPAMLAGVLLKLKDDPDLN